METNHEHKKSSVAVGCPSQSDLAGKADVCAGCPGRQLCLTQNSIDPDQMYIDVRMKAIKRKVLVLSGKGGVGKSSVAGNLAIALASICGNKKVGLLDLDICGPSVPKLMNVENLKVINSEYGWIPLESPHYGIKVMSAGSLIQENSSADHLLGRSIVVYREVRGLIIQVKVHSCIRHVVANGLYRESIVWRGPRKTDTPPGTSDEHLTIIRALVNAKPEGAIIVTTPQDVAMDTICKEIDFCHKMGINIIGIVENMSGFICPCCKENFKLFSEGGASKLSGKYNIPIIGRLPLDPNIVTSCENGSNIQQENPESPAAIAIMEIARTLHEQKVVSI